jgi:hypothetical protein
MLQCRTSYRNIGGKVSFLPLYLTSVDRSTLVGNWAKLLFISSALNGRIEVPRGPQFTRARESSSNQQNTIWTIPVADAENSWGYCKPPALWSPCYYRGIKSTQPTESKTTFSFIRHNWSTVFVLGMHIRSPDFTLAIQYWVSHYRHTTCGLTDCVRSYYMWAKCNNIMYIQTCTGAELSC